MTTLFRRLVALSFALATAVVALPTPALALNADVGVMTGAGGYNPALGALPASHAVAMGGNLLSVGTHGVALNFSCGFAGNEIGNFAAGDGVFAGACGPIALPLCVYVRAGAWEPVACVENDAQIKAATMLLEVVPSQNPPTPTADFTFAGTFTYGEINSP